MGQSIRRGSGILIVEDDESTCDVMAMILESEGFKVYKARDGADALRYLLAAHVPCLIILDLMMPVMSGLELANILKQHSGLASIPIVVASAYIHGRETAQAIGAVEFIPKPVDIDRLVNVAKAHC